MNRLIPQVVNSIRSRGDFNAATRDLLQAYRRLARATTQRQRHNARVAWRAAIKRLDRETLAKFPTIGPDGKEREPKKRRGYVCPICNRPQRDITRFVDHLVLTHRRTDCPCGYIEAIYKARGGVMPHGMPNSHVRMLRKHLAGIKDVTFHWTAAVLKDAAMANGGAK